MKLRLGARVSSDSPDAVGRFLVGKFTAQKRQGPLKLAHVSAQLIFRPNVGRISSVALIAGRILVRP